MRSYLRTEGDVCYACLGGWGIIGRLSLSTEWMRDHQLRDIVRFRNISFWTLGCYQVSLDRARNGNVYEAFAMMGLNPAAGNRYNCAVADYHLDTPAFYRDMHRLADQLQQDGY